MAKSRQSRPAPAAPPPAPPTAGAERIVAVSLAAMALVLLWVFVDLKKSAASGPVLRFDFTNLLLGARAGECIEIEGDRLVVASPSPVLRPRNGPEQWPGASDARSALPYLACEKAASEGRQPPGAPPAARETFLFPLNAFGMPADTAVALESVEPREGIRWNGSMRRGWLVVLRRYDSIEGPWKLFLSKDAPVLGTMMREYFSSDRIPRRQRFLVPEGCR